MATPATVSVDTAHTDFDARAFRRCLGLFATGVTVVTAQAGDLRAGVTANSFSSLSLDPPLILWSISRSSRNFPVFRDASHFAVNVLGAHQIDVSQCFSSSDTDKFARVGWKPGIGDAPVVDGVLATFECSTEAQHDGGDHVIMVGRVQRFTQFDGAPLLFAQGRYGVAEDHPDLRPALPVSTHLHGTPVQDSPLMTLLFHAHHVTYSNFEDRRQAEGLTIPQIRVLTGLYDTPQMTLQQLTERMYLGLRDAEDAVADLLEQGDVARTGDGDLALTPQGRSRREAFRRRIAAFEAEYLSEIPASEIASGRRLLERLIAKRPA